jgi:hypothetical protein
MAIRWHQLKPAYQFTTVLACTHGETVDHGVYKYMTHPTEQMILEIEADIIARFLDDAEDLIDEISGSQLAFPIDSVRERLLPSQPLR